MATNIYINLSNDIKINDSITMYYIERLTHKGIICTIPIYLIMLINKYVKFNSDHCISIDNNKIVNILILQKDLLNTYSNMKLKLNKPQLGKSFYLIPMSIQYQNNILHVYLCIKTTIKETKVLCNNNEIRKIIMVKLSKFKLDRKYFEAKFKMSFGTDDNKENATKLHSFLMDKTQSESTITLSYEKKNLELKTLKKICKKKTNKVIQLTFYFGKQF